ncbi:helix-turn-helix domain-containing protein [Streptomyces hoynatensis]|uniref:XRE family transcriptional regulator n=1 Tax=Streptomyces hoynatensis TaxID=1141874 RepID=A0A3A9YXN0_9ACTN|nr:helix-turn-helix transcriptional regulator [Streptomyces hoynatensis]RKN40404.1 XRE family transcriptional regulator [Streptomyces hoynatensis]
MTFQAGELTPDRSARHFYGADLRRYREAHQMSLGRLAGEVPCSKSHLARIETAESMPPPGLSEEFDRVFKTDGHFTRLYELARREIHPEQYRRHLELEAQATVIRSYAGLLVPGLVQTAGYAEALFRATMPKAEDAEVKQLVEARLSRQMRLREPQPPDYSVILDEAALRRAVGGPAVMRAQLDALLDLVHTRHTVVQVLPFEHGEHGLMGGTLTLLSLESGATYAYEESIATGTLLEDPEKVGARLRAYDLLRSYALPPGETAAFLRGVRKALPADGAPA